MIQLYFKGEWSNSCSEVPDGTMITVQSNTYEAKYSALKAMGVSHGAAGFAANSKWETAQEREKRMHQPTATSKSSKTESPKTTTTSSNDIWNEYDRDEDNIALSAQYLEMQQPEVKKELAHIAKRRAHIASDTSISATERLKETLNCIVQAYHSQNSIIVNDNAKRDLKNRTISEIKQVISQAPIPDEGDELTDFITYVKSGAIKPKKKSKLFNFILRYVKNKMTDGNLGDDDRDGMENEDLILNEDQVIGNLLYQKLWEIVDVKPEHPLIVPLAKIKLMKKRAPIELIGILNVVILSSELIYSPLLGLGICVAGWLANEFADVDKKCPIQIKSRKLPTHLIATIVLNIIIAIISYEYF